MFHTPGRSRPPTQTFRESLDAHGGVCLFRRAAGGLALLLLAASAHAATIPLFNTGVDGNGNPLAPGASDPHWQLIAGEGVTAPVPAVIVSEQHPSGQYFETTDSMWIWTDASGNGANTPYTFRLSFDLTGFDPGSVSISGFWGIDDKFCPATGATAIASRCPNAKVHLLSHCGHWVMVEHQDYFNRMTLDFLRDGRA